MNVTETIQTFLEFFAERGHQVIPGSSLVPPDGDQVLFTTAGMHPLTPLSRRSPPSSGQAASRRAALPASIVSTLSRVSQRPSQHDKRNAQAIELQSRSWFR